MACRSFPENSEKIQNLICEAISLYDLLQFFIKKQIETWQKCYRTDSNIEII
jgi:hypothetical protein